MADNTQNQDKNREFKNPQGTIGDKRYPPTAIPKGPKGEDDPLQTPEVGNGPDGQNAKG